MQQAGSMDVDGPRADAGFLADRLAGLTRLYTKVGEIILVPMLLAAS
jgi:hypothetical protein